MKKIKISVSAIVSAVDIIREVAAQSITLPKAVIGGGSGRCCAAIIGVDLIGKGKGAAIGAAVGAAVRVRVQVLPSVIRWIRSCRS